MKIAYIDHSYRRKTKSTDFFLNLLQEKHQVDLYFDKQWMGQKRLHLSKFEQLGYECLILFQIKYPANEINRLNLKNIIYVPMYDSTGIPDYQYWTSIKKCKILSFSKIIYLQAQLYGLDSLYVQYFSPLNAIKRKKIKNKLSIYFWYRVNDIDFKIVKKLINPKYIQRLIINKSNDPYQNQINLSKKDQDKYKIEFCQWVSNKSKLNEILKDCDLFIAPRKLEGIGLSFIDAMSHGIVVIGNNEPTMNEYIDSEVNGYLFEIQNPKNILFHNYLKIQNTMIDFVNKGHQKWIKSTHNIHRFIKKNTRINKFNMSIKMLDKMHRLVKNNNHFIKILLECVNYCIYEKQYMFAQIILDYCSNIATDKTMKIEIQFHNAVFHKYRNHKNWKQYFKKLIRILKNNITEYNSIVLLSKIYHELDENKKALAYLKCYKRKDKTSKYYYKIGEICCRLGDKKYRYYFKKSLDLFGKKSNHKDHDLYLMASMAKRINKLSDAIGYYSEVIKLNTDKRLVSAAYFHLGDIYFHQGILVKAISYMKKCLSFNEDHQKAKEILKKCQIMDKNE